MRKFIYYILLFYGLSNLSYAGDWQYIGKDASNKYVYYINTNPDTLTVYKNAYTFWFKVFTNKKKVIEASKITIYTKDQSLCISSYQNFDNPGKNFDFDCYYTRKIYYSPDSMTYVMQEYLDQKFGKRIYDE